ncbi:hypothetical protein SAMN05216332_11137 [Nitrosospira briensis]|nr:hypothetical protein SAMN05216332_11137 [Nitrosospira briensis]
MAPWGNYASRTRAREDEETEWIRAFFSPMVIAVAFWFSRYTVATYSLLPPSGTVKVPKNALTRPSYGTVTTSAVLASGTVLSLLKVLAVPPKGIAFLILLNGNLFINAYPPL